MPPSLALPSGALSAAGLPLVDVATPDQAYLGLDQHPLA